MFKAQLYTMFDDSNEDRKAEQKVDNLRMKESGHVSLYISYFRSLIARIGYWGERPYIHVYRRGLASRLLDYLASHPGTFDILQELMDITFELDNSVALVGELETPSFPSSVHIPSIMPSQSLIPSRDEVLKERKYVGEDFAMYSLHFFQGDMDLPPLSFHAPWEEKWDYEKEPEEIEIVMKVVSPAYHQYLDVFSKVKAEKIPHTAPVIII
ncbi:hypothetical protein O181_009084 [Austropuccinia psidii MF-1]|uniref:Retrotransposon gag domain-containing protein n=1 Tax=Austropuccinia psidii MF-1 TaxID=1389203 RepID=A0A9Q3BQ52_9BASI|nr:hypothetical protein [Austropuccinia psidii MF-1]